MDWGKLIDAAHAANERDGIDMGRGKKYSTVAIRMDLFRRHFGDWGIETEIVQFSAQKGEPVVMRARITDAAGRVVATGHAFEIVGDGNVNRIAALENAETSAIGRALAALGLHGGEFASANEIDGAGRKDVLMAAAEGLRQAWIDGILDSLPENASQHDKDRAFANAIIAQFHKMKSLKGLRSTWAKRQDLIDEIRARHPEICADIDDAFALCERTFTQPEEGEAA